MMSRTTSSLGAVLVFPTAVLGLSVLLACSKPSPTQQGSEQSDVNPKAAQQVPNDSKQPAPAEPQPAAQPQAVGGAVQPAVVAGAAAPASVVKLGEAAPDFTLKDLDGKSVSLSQFKGKTVVLEWFNPQCPFVQRSHKVGSLKSLAKEQSDKGVVWLAINSAAPGKQGHGVDVNREGVQAFGITHPVLQDESGSVGRLYGAQRTPHLYVIDAQGVLVYRGAIDNSPDGEGASPKGGKLVNHVAAALSDVAAKRAVQTAETEAYGCSVKYANL